VYALVESSIIIMIVVIRNIFSATEKGLSCFSHITLTMSKKRKPGVLSNTAKKKLAYAAHKKALRGEKVPPARPAPSKGKKQNQRPPPPFNKNDCVLLVGEGDFSFALALKKHLGVRNITATCYDDKQALAEKYPQAVDNIAAFVDTNISHISVRLQGTDKEAEDDQGKEAEHEDIDETLSDWENTISAKPVIAAGEFKVLYAIDATKLLKRRIFSKSSRRYDRIAFQFPHVGGITKNQTRQVRYNQELLLSFFENAKPLLTPDTGIVIVTLFEGQPYELWNIRALAKEAGLFTKTSFTFEASEYPGYKHSRTLGNIDGKGGAWKGEERKARMYIFGVEAAWTVGNRKKMDRAGSDNQDD